MPNTTQSTVFYSNEIFKQYLMQISTGIVWKNSSRANSNESSNLVDMYLSELFVVANRGLLNFDIVKAFPRSILLNSGIPESDIAAYAADKTKIPVYHRDAIVKTYENALASRDPITGRPAFLNTITGKYETVYTETNNYYRMLMGLPNIEDSNYIFNTDSRWSTTIPIHELPLIDRLEMENAGILKELMLKYPDKEYIRYLGKKYIDPFKSRVADRFEILYQPESISDNLNSEFVNAYNNARHLVMSVYYTNSYRKSNVLYDNFMALCILFIALQAMQYKYLQVDITRDFYDTESLKLVYDSYGVPFYNEIPLEYHRKIVKNINKLISYKGSSQVFLDLFDLFDVRSMDMYSYFLTKIHRFDEFGNPTFIIKRDAEGNELVDNEGNPILDESNYDIKFAKVKIYDDPALSISDDANVVGYEELTAYDPYWIEDPDLIAKLAGENFNYTESKYIGIQTVFDMMKITYENAYIFRMIMDNKNLTSMMEYRWSDIGITCSIFDLFIYLSSLYCRYYGYEGIINEKIPAIMDTLGYDFNAAKAIIKDRVSSSPFIEKNARLIELITNIEITNIDSIDVTCKDINEIRSLLIDGYTNATTIDEYRAYRDLYNSIMVSREISEVYTNKNTGEIYETFTDVLSGSSPALMQRYLLLSDAAVIDEITITIAELEKIISSLRHLTLSTGISSSSMIDSLFKILTFFKSAKAELTGYNIAYVFTMRGINFIKMLDICTQGETWGKLPDESKLIDMIHIITDMLRHKSDVVNFIDANMSSREVAYIKDYTDFLDDIIMSFSQVIETIFKDTTWYIDFLQGASFSLEISSKMKLSDIDAAITYFEVLGAKYTSSIKDKSISYSDFLFEYATDGNRIPVT